jgi:hypothetical protein
VWGTKRLSTLDEGVPICATLRREELGSLWARVLVKRLRHIEAVGAFHHSARSERSVHGDSLAFA